MGWAKTRDLERDTKRKEMTVSALREPCLTDGTKTKEMPMPAAGRGRMARHIKPLLGNHRIAPVFAFTASAIPWPALALR